MGVSVIAAAGDGNVTFYRSWWGWRRLPDLVERFAPDLYEKVEYWQFNEGDGLHSRDAVTLADILDDAIHSGAVQAWLDQEDARIADLPDERCPLCFGTGMRTDKVGREMGFDKPMMCNGCSNSGTTPGWRKNPKRMYMLDMSDVREWAKFCRNSRGFSIC